MATRVQFIHGLEGSPQGHKARLLDSCFEARAAAMDTSDFEGCVLLQADTINQFDPDVLVGSSFGGAVALALLQRGLWQGPTLLLAQAGLRYGLPALLPAGVPVWIVHGLRDVVIDPEDSRTLAAHGDPQQVRLIEVDDDHGLFSIVGNEDLVRWVNELAELA
ncbi:MAG: hypothetical protein HKN49_09435 [Gammaproteobacteria bacterium]|nr:hypothetical protein [Gammaproteobacteria bacterium]